MGIVEKETKKEIKTDKSSNSKTSDFDFNTPINANLKEQASDDPGVYEKRMRIRETFMTHTLHTITHVMDKMNLFRSVQNVTIGLEWD